MIEQAQHELVLGEVPLVAADPTGLPYEIDTLAELDLGNPEPNIAEIRSFLDDGSLAQVINYGNRQPVIRVEITGPTLDDLALGEKALVAEVAKGRNTLAWTPPDEFAATTVFDVVWSRLDFTFDDMDEGRRRRTFVITLTCLPFGRPEVETVVEAVGSGEAPPTPVTAVIDDGTSTSGWSVGSSWVAVPATGPTVVSGGVQAASGGQVRAFRYSYTLTRSGLASDMTSTPLLAVEVPATIANATTVGFTFSINGVAVLPVAQNGWVYYFDCADFPTLNTFVVAHHLLTSSTPHAVHSATMRVNEMSRTNVMPFSGTGRQQFRLMEIPGSVTTAGSFEIAHETSALGDVILYTNEADESGAQPPCRAYRVAGGTVTPDTSTASGARSPLNAATPETYEIPASKLQPGTHQVIALVRQAVTAFAGINVEASTRLGAVEIGSQSRPNILVVESAWTLADLGQLTLPSVALPAGSPAVVRLEVSSAQPVEIDDLYLFNLATGSLTVVRAGSGTPVFGGASSRLWIKAPVLDNPNPSTWLGTLTDGSDSRHTWGNTEVRSLGRHPLIPGMMNVFSLTTGAINAAVSARFFERYHSHVLSSAS